MCFAGQTFQRQEERRQARGGRALQRFTQVARPHRGARSALSLTHTDTIKLTLLADPFPKYLLEYKSRE